ncbi:S9 family peptidase [Ramlibacter sp. USB13]|uniref:S9 family peptidase n=1 Tax=Ramlibacter cellulosilyticus TaxID=2764187 RepID=A0A923MV03_9BURK|nr:S9 family peptidase [Ramlibacter cellulosilyticus]MBC5785900.1 S9 family peptidase [Ramlibacter cellulosilyticus]
MTQPFTVQDLYLHQVVKELDASADGAQVACTLRSVDREQDDYVSCIWSVPADGSAPRQLTRGPGQDQAPRWSPQGDRLAFISSRGGSPRVHLLPRDGGEAVAIGQLPGAVSDLRWLPDGRALIVSAAVPVDPDWRGERPAGRQPKQRKVQPQVAWKLPYKSDGMGYMLAREIHLFRLDAQSGEHRQLTDGAFDVLACGISADGRQLAYTRTREGRFAHRSDLWTSDIEGRQPRQRTHEFATVMSPLWSPNGRWIAFSATRAEGDAQTSLYLLEEATGKVRRLGDADLQVADPASVHWTGDARGLVFVRQVRGRHQVVRIAVDTGKLDVLVEGNRQLGAFAPAGDVLVYAVDHPSQPSEVHACTPGQGERQLSDFNPWWKERTPILVETWEFDVPDGRGGREKIEGWLLRREGASGPLPLLNDVHGGPAAYALLDFDTNVYWQVLCSQGWAVLALNAVGSASYGREFCDRLMGHWGEYDLPQHLAALKQLRDEGVCDERIAVAGKSYGGYLSAWAIGKSETFRAAVVMAPVGNIETHYGTSDGGYYADPYYMGTEERFDRKLAKELSPMAHVEKATTPTLFLQGAEDERCPKCQSEELFVSLMRAGDTPAELVIYPDENHTFLGEGRPSVREDAAQRIIDWVGEHTSRAPAPHRQQQDTQATQGEGG